MWLVFLFFFFFFNDTATTEIYTLSLHDALPICGCCSGTTRAPSRPVTAGRTSDRKSTRLNSSHLGISYAVFCLKKTENNTEVDVLRTRAAELLARRSAHVRA